MSRLLLVGVLIVLVTLLLAPMAGSGSTTHAANADDGFSEEDVRFESGDVTLHGTILVANGAFPGRKPAMALIHGSGPGPRELRRADAEAFAREGIVTLIYDKRTEGYSESGLGERSYELLAQDALAAVRALRAHPEVDPDAVGLWGRSEGGWVGPLAANRSKEVAFVVLVGASGVSPARQVSWFLESQLRHLGVTGSMVKAVSRTGIRVQVGTDGFAEAYHDPVGPLERLRQPVLAMWGEKDRVVPPAESARIVQGALERGGNERYAIRFIPDADHGLYSSPDGFVPGDVPAPEYPDTVGSWVEQVVGGEEPGPSVAGPAPEQTRPSRPITPLAWWESGLVQLGALVLPALAFASYLAIAFGAALARRMRGRPYEAPEATTSQVRRWALWLASAGLVTILGFVCYFGLLVVTAASVVGPIVAGRSLPWLALQALSVATCTFTLLLAVSWRSSPKVLAGADRAQAGIVLAGGAAFAVWAAYWGLLSP
ncbi:MAG TPA: prolyl oligopeptidase family serine peptidase [Rubrobacter sp.]|jgi:pimeloyl-ACP methyl ester carboxylesterase|nr:prolyl oligopeptidase family serine peptidase [Rubrobacter sp.]